MDARWIPRAAALIAALVATGCIRTGGARLEELEQRLDVSAQSRRGQIGRLKGRLEALEAEVRALEHGEVRRGFTRSAARRATEAERYGGTLRLALGVDPPSLDPARLTDTTSYRVARQVLEGLVDLDPDLRVRPRLAETWEISPDLTTYTFHLKPGVLFHNGREVTADDFVYTFTRILDPETASVRVWILDRVRGYPTFAAFRRYAEVLRDPSAAAELGEAARASARARLEGADAATLRSLGHPAPEATARLAADLLSTVDGEGPASAAERERLEAAARALDVRDFVGRSLEAVDDHTFRIRLVAPFAPFLQLLTMVQVSVVPREEVERLREDFAFRPVGTGPFRVMAWEHDVKVTLDAWEHYHGGRPYLDRLEFRVIPDPVTQLTEFEVGNLDVLTRLADEKYEQVKGSDDFAGVLLEEPTLHIFYLGMNAGREPFDDVRVRRAFNHAVDKRAILEKIRKGRGVLAKGPLPPMLPSHDPDLEGYAFDPDRAVELLAEAGYDPPSRIGTVDFWYNSSTGNDVNAKIAEVFQENLRQIGVDMALHSVDWGTYLDKAKRCEPPIFRLAWIASYPDADGFLYALLHSSSIGQTNMACYRNPEFDRLLEAARETHDPAARIRLYREAERIVVEDAAWIPLFHNRDVLVLKPDVRGARLSARGADAVSYGQVWLER